MKNFLLVVLLVFCAFSYAQDNSNTIPKHEVKTDMFNLIVFKAPQFSYEYLLNDESSVGVSIMFNLENPEDGSFIDGPYYYENFAFTPYYRRFISNKYARGFFIEVFGMYNVQGDFDGTWDNNFQNVTYSDETSNNLAFGVSLGGKLVSKGGFVVEFYGGVGRNIIIGNEDIGLEFLPRVGISLGYRF